MDEKRDGEYLQVYINEAENFHHGALQDFTDSTNQILKAIADAGGTIVERNLDYVSNKFVMRIIYSLPEGATLSEA